MIKRFAKYIQSRDAVSGYGVQTSQTLWGSGRLTDTKLLKFTRVGIRFGGTEYAVELDKQGTEQLRNNLSDLLKRWDERLVDEPLTGPCPDGCGVDLINEECPKCGNTFG